jgi:serine/threonine-protein kinase RsbW
MKELRILPGAPPALAHCMFRRSWPSRIDLKQEIMDVLAEQLISRGWVAEADRHWIYLCLDEALVNAMLHGNEGDPALAIEVALLGDDARWALMIDDQGTGFSAANVPDHEQPQSLMLEHGRGIRIMQEWLDELVYYRNGACAWLSRRRDDARLP